MLLITALVLVLFLPCSAYATSDLISVNVQDMDIREVIRIIANQSGTNIIAEKSVRGNVTVQIQDLYYEEAMNLVARTNGYAVRKIGNTWVLAHEDILIDAFERGLTITRRLQYARAADVAQVISSTIRGDTRVATDERINAVIVSGGKDILEEIEKLIDTIDTPVHQVMMEAKIVEVNSEASRRIGFNWQAGNQEDGLVPFGGTDSDHGIPIFSTKEYFANNPDSALYQGGLGDGQGSLFGLGDFYRQSLLFRATFAALENRGETKVLSNPKISAMNGQEAMITVGRTVIYPGGADQPPSERDVGIMLSITPRINDDGYVTVDAEPEVSVVEGWSDDGRFPRIGTRHARTTVRVRDGEEILIGGLIEDHEDNSSNRIPLLGRLPVVGNLFRTRSRSSDSLELIILITPHIIAQTIDAVSPASFGTTGGMSPNAAGGFGTVPGGSTGFDFPMGSVDDSFDSAFDTSF